MCGTWRAAGLAAVLVGSGLLLVGTPAAWAEGEKRGSSRGDDHRVRHHAASIETIGIAAQLARTTAGATPRDERAGTGEGATN